MRLNTIGSVCLVFIIPWNLDVVLKVVHAPQIYFEVLFRPMENYLFVTAQFIAENKVIDYVSA